jgi:hypothetical protein
MTKIDNFIPTTLGCMVCKAVVDLHTSHYGRIVVSWIKLRKDSLTHFVIDGAVASVPTSAEHYFPKKITGRVCKGCFDKLYNTTWRDKSNHLRRAFETLHEPVIQPKNDDYEAAKITKGLYAPHAGKGLKSTIIHESRPQKEKLKGFNRR